MEDTYTFWYVDDCDTLWAEHNLTKRKATRKFNKLQKNYNPEIKRFGWAKEKIIGKKVKIDGRPFTKI